MHPHHNTRATLLVWQILRQQIRKCGRTACSKRTQSLARKTNAQTSMPTRCVTNSKHTMRHWWGFAWVASVAPTEQQCTSCRMHVRFDTHPLSLVKCALNCDGNASKTPRMEPDSENRNRMALRMSTACVSGKKIACTQHDLLPKPNPGGESPAAAEPEQKRLV